MSRVFCNTALLRILTSLIYLQESQSEVDEIGEALSKFNGLQHVEISPHSDGMGFRSLYRALLDEAGRTRVAMRLMTHCPSLKRVGLLAVLGRLSWYARSKKDAQAEDTVIFT